MQDLNDLLYFAKVVEHGGFMAAGRVLGIPKSRLSRRVAELEERLGVRLLQRTTRQLSLTEVGQSYYLHCQAMLAEAEAADEAISKVTAEPRGLIKVTCPELLAKSLLGPLLPRFLSQYPQVRISLEATSRRVDIIEEAIDVAIRVRNVINDNINLVVRQLGISRVILVASPEFLEAHAAPRHPGDIGMLPSLVMSSPDSKGHWGLLDSNGHLYNIQLEQPRLMTDDLIVLLQAAISGMGVAALPYPVCCDAIEEGKLVRLLPDFESPWGILHAVYPTRRGLLPAVRVFIDFLVSELLPAGHTGGYERIGAVCPAQ